MRPEHRSRAREHGEEQKSEYLPLSGRGIIPQKFCRTEPLGQIEPDCIIHSLARTNPGGTCFSFLCIHCSIKARNIN